MADQLDVILPDDAATEDSQADRRSDTASAVNELPNGIVFFDPAVELPEADPFGGVPSAEWSAPTVFYQNGRTLNARFRLASRDYDVDLFLRGLTGTITIGEVRKTETGTDVSPEDFR